MKHEHELAYKTWPSVVHTNKWVKAAKKMHFFFLVGHNHKRSEKHSTHSHMLSTKKPMHREIKQVALSHTACKWPDLGQNSSSSAGLCGSSTPYYLKLPGSAARGSPWVRLADSTEPLPAATILPQELATISLSQQDYGQRMAKKGMRWI